MFYSDDVIEEVRSRNDVVDLIGNYIKLTKKGSSYFGLCPFHNEKSPSFSVSRDKQMYYCFGCGAGGNVFTFVMEYENYTFVEAVKYLAERAGIKLPEVEVTEEQKRIQNKRQQLLDIQKQAAQYFYYQLKSKTAPMPGLILKSVVLQRRRSPILDWVFPIPTVMICISF